MTLDLTQEKIKERQEALTEASAILDRSKQCLAAAELIGKASYLSTFDELIVTQCGGKKLNIKLRSNSAVTIDPVQLTEVDIVSELKRLFLRLASDLEDQASYKIASISALAQPQSTKAEPKR